MFTSNWYSADFQALLSDLFLHKRKNYCKQITFVVVVILVEITKAPTKWYAVEGKLISIF